MVYSEQFLNDYYRNIIKLINRFSHALDYEIKKIKYVESNGRYVKGKIYADAKEILISTIYGKEEALLTVQHEASHALAIEENNSKGHSRLFLHYLKLINSKHPDIKKWEERNIV
jgi:hypothetical protein